MQISSHSTRDEFKPSQSLNARSRRLSIRACGTSLYRALLALPSVSQVVIMLKRNHRQSRRRRSGNRVLSHVTVALLWFVVSSMVFTGEFAIDFQPRLSTRLQSSVLGVPPILPWSTVNDSVRNITNFLVNATGTNLSIEPNATSISPSLIPTLYSDEPTYDSDIMSMFNSLNATPTFNSLVIQNASNFTFSINYDNVSGITNVTYGVAWTNWNGEGDTTSYLEYWLGSLPASTTSGPITISESSIARVPPGCGTQSSAGSCSSNNWAGFEWWPQGHIVSYAHEITNVQGIYRPPSGQIQAGGAPPGTYQPYAAPWFGFSAGAMARGGPIIQTGYEQDPQNQFNCNYQPLCLPYETWWENFPGYQYPYPNSGVWVVVPGSWISFTVAEVACYAWGCMYSAGVYDYTTGHGSSMATYTGPNYSPRYVDSVLEAAGPKHSITPSQVAKFSPRFAFEGPFFTRQGMAFYPAQYYNAGSYNDITLNQAQNYVSSSQSFSTSSNLIVTTWLSSEYNYNYV